MHPVLRRLRPRGAACAMLLLAAAAPLAAQTADSARVPAATTADTARPAAPRPALPAFQIRMTGRVQTVYQNTAPSADADADGSGPLPADTSLFRVHRARLGFTGWVHDPRIEFELQADLAGQSALLRRAWVGFRARGEAVQLRAGRFIVPFGRQQMSSLFGLPTVDRVSLADHFGRGHDDGVMVWGTPAGGRVEYYAGVFNGDGFNRNTQQDAANLWTARAVWAPLGRFGYATSAWGDTRRPRVALGASASRNGGWLWDVDGRDGLQGPTRACVDDHCTTDWGDEAAARTLGADAALRWRGTSLAVEAFRRDLRPHADTLAAVRSDGWYAQGSVFVVPRRVELGGRHARFTPRRGERAGRTAETSPFAVLYLRGNDIKATAEWSRIRETFVGGDRTTRRARASLLFTF